MICQAQDIPICIGTSISQSESKNWIRHSASTSLGLPIHVSSHICYCYLEFAWQHKWFCAHTLSLNINPKFYCILKHRAGSSLNISSSTTYQLLLLISYYQEFISLFSHKQYSPLHSFTNIASQYASHPNISHLLTNSFWFPNLYHTLFTQILITLMLGL
jgi:hypothetical protein